MILLFAPAGIALLVIAAIWLSTLFTRQPKPMLEQVQKELRTQRMVRFYTAVREAIQ